MTAPSSPRPARSSAGLASRKRAGWSRGHARGARTRSAICMRTTGWQVTEAGWWALARSGAYSEERDDVLESGRPPVRRAVALLLVAGPRTVAELTDALR